MSANHENYIQGVWEDCLSMRCSYPAAVRLTAQELELDPQTVRVAVVAMFETGVADGENIQKGLQAVAQMIERQNQLQDNDVPAERDNT